MNTFKSYAKKSAIGLVTILAALATANAIPSPWDTVADAVITVAAFYSISPVTKHQQSRPMLPPPVD